MIRQNRAVPILLVLTFAWILYLGGCFGSEDSAVAGDLELEVVAPTPTAPPVVTDSAAAVFGNEDPFVHTIEEGDLLPSIATTYNVPQAVILRANPDLNPNVLIVGTTIRIPGASTVNRVDEDIKEQQEGESIDYVIEAGDSFNAIALTWTVKPEALIEANPDVDPANLQIGQLITIPKYGTGYTAEELAEFTKPTCAVREPGKPLLHPVEPGDTISALAGFYGVTVDELMAANALADENQLVVGEELTVPPPSQESSCD